MGKLKGIRKNGKGRRFNRKINSFPFHKLSSYIKYKAEWLGIPVITVSEAYTSQTCSRCGTRGLRVRGLFRCPSCGLNLNADWNGARNILKRGMGELKRQSKQSMLGAPLTAPRTPPRSADEPMMRGESPDFSRGECQDCIHIASAAEHNVRNILSSDKELDKIEFIRRIDPL